MFTKSEAENELNLIIFNHDRLQAHLHELSTTAQLCAERDLEAMIVAAWKIKNYLQKQSMVIESQKQSGERSGSGGGCQCQDEGIGCCKQSS